MGHLQNIQSFETSVETGNMQSYEKQSILAAGCSKSHPTATARMVL